MYEDETPVIQACRAAQGLGFLHFDSPELLEVDEHREHPALVAMAKWQGEEPNDEISPEDTALISEVNAAQDEITKFPERELAKHISERLLKKFVEAPSQRTDMLVSAHAQGHFGAEELFKYVWRQGYYWPGLRQDCQRTVQQCRP
jgi:hypothetical protein